MVVTKSYTEPPICKKEILRYAGCKYSNHDSLQFSAENGDFDELLEECLKEVLPKLSYKVCYMELPLTIEDDVCDFGCMQIQSKDLAKNLQGCEKAILFAATIGVEIDRLIMKYGAVSPAKAVLFQAIGAERIESLCDVFCAAIQDEACQQNETCNITLRPRFSPGYGDLPLEMQKAIFQVLNCGKNIGVSLNDSLLMSPSKSVTAFVGINNATSSGLMNDASVVERLHNCAICKMTDCAYRM